jgi:cell division protein FtsZ
VDEDANIIFGSAIDETLSGKIRVSVVATGIDRALANEAHTPRLVAVGGGAPAATPIPMPASAVAAASAANAAHVGMASPLRAVAHAPLESAGDTGTGGPGYAMAQPAPAFASAPQQAPRAPASAGASDGGPAQAPSRGLFAGAPRHHPAPAAGPLVVPAPVEPRSSLFRAVTGRLRGMTGAPLNGHAAAAGAVAGEQARAEPILHEQRPEPTRASVRQTAAEEVGLDIPAFLRRQSS